MDDVTTPRGTPEDYREFVKQMEAAAERESARARALKWRDVSDEERSRVIAELFNLGAMTIRITGFRKQPLDYRQLPNVRWTPRRSP